MKRTTLPSTDHILIGILALVVTAVLALFISLSFFNHPSADDFCFAAKARQLGFIDAQTFWYKNWSGRYTLNAVWTAIMLSGDIVRNYPWPAVILLLSTWLSLSFFTASISQKRHSAPFIFLLGGVGTVQFISGTPDPAQTFYWLGGSITYQLANILLILLLGLLFRRETSVKSRILRTGIFALCCLLVLAITGSNEVSLLLTGIIICCGTVCAVRTGRDSRAFWMGLLLTVSGTAVVSILAPGNFQRYAGIGGNDFFVRPAPWLALMLYLPWVGLRLLYWLSNLGLWASAFIVLAATLPDARAWLCQEGNFNRRFLILPALWIGTIFALNAIGFLINRYPLPERAASVVWLAFILGWYPSFVILFHYLAGEKIQAIPRRTVQLAAVLLIISLLGTPNVFEAYKDVYRAYRYNREMGERYSAIQKAKDRGETDIVVDSLSRPPKTLFATDISTDPRNHRNQCMREYYEVHSIRLGDRAR